MSDHQHIVGHFDDDGNPCILFHIQGVKHPHPGLEYAGIIDTGFSGFIQLPIDVGVHLSLPLEGTKFVTLADKSEIHLLTALADVTLGEETKTGTALLSWTSGNILIGMEFLRKFERALFISEGTGVMLVKEISINSP